MRCTPTWQSNTNSLFGSVRNATCTPTMLQILNQYVCSYRYECLSVQLHRLFALFVREWNNGTLPARYAAGITLAAAARTAYRWPFVDKLDPVRLGHVVDEVDRATHADSVIRVAASETKKSAPAATGAAGGDLSIDNSSKKRKEKGKSDSEDSEERRWREKDAKKKDVKAFAKRKDAVMEELAPKPTGKDAQLEKKKQESAYHRKADDDAQADLEAFDPYGEGPSIKARIAREREQRQRNADAKLDSYHKALADYKVQHYYPIACLCILMSDAGA